MGKEVEIDSDSPLAKAMQETGLSLEQLNEWLKPLDKTLTVTPPKSPVVGEVFGEAQASPTGPPKAKPAELSDKEKFEKRLAVVEPGMIEVADNLKLAAYESFSKLQSAAEDCREAAKKIKAAREESDFAKANLALDDAEKALAALNEGLPKANANVKKPFESAKSGLEADDLFKRYAKLIADGKFGNPPPTKAKFFDLGACVGDFTGARKRMSDCEIAGNYVVAMKGVEKAKATVTALDGEVAKFIGYCQTADAKAEKIVEGVKNPIYKDAVKDAAKALKAVYDPADAAVKKLGGDKEDYGTTWPLVMAVEVSLKDFQTLSAAALSQLATQPPKEARAEIIKFLKQDPGVLKELANQDGGKEFIDKLVADLGGSAKEPENKDFVKAALMARFNLDKVDGDLTKKALPRLYSVMLMVPESHTRDNDRLKNIERHRGSKDGASWYEGKTDRVILNLERTGKWRGSTENMTGDKSGKIKVESFDSTTLHEIGHSVDEKRGFFTDDGSMLDTDKYGGWRIEDIQNIIKLAVDDQGLATDMSPKFERAALVKFVNALLAGGKPDEIVEGDPVLKAAAAKDKKALLKHDVVKWCETVRIKGEHTGLWDQGSSGAKTAAIKGRVYQESYKGKWTSYLQGARAKGVSQYQFRAPGEWFAELYALYYLKKLPASHADYKWFKELVDV